MRQRIRRPRRAVSRSRTSRAHAHNRSAGARATFFMIGEQVRRRPSLAAEVMGAGHAVALHGDRHRLQLRLAGSEVRRDLELGAAAIAEATGQAPVWHRPPYGIYSAAGL